MHVKLFYNVAESYTNRLGGKFVKIASAFIAPDDDPVYANELAPNPSLSTATRLRAQQGEVASIINLDKTSRHLSITSDTTAFNFWTRKVGPKKPL